RRRLRRAAPPGAHHPAQTSRRYAQHHGARPRSLRAPGAGQRNRGGEPRALLSVGRAGHALRAHRQRPTPGRRQAGRGGDAGHVRRQHVSGCRPARRRDRPRRCPQSAGRSRRAAGSSGRMPLFRRPERRGNGPGTRRRHGDRQTRLASRTRLARSRAEVTMTPERWRHVQSIFLEAADLPPGRQRDEFLADACGADAGLRREVEALLAADADPPPVLAASIDELAELVLDDLPFEPAMPQRVGPYRIVREIGRGGMGTVYLAERDDGQFEQRVALKLIRRDDDHVMQRFLSERQILASLQHPNIARLYDGGRTDDGRPYLVMEYVNGKPIDVYCDERRLPIDERLRL